MRSRTKDENRRAAYPILIDAEGLSEMLSIGKVNAAKIARSAGADIKAGRLTLYKVDALRDYINAASGDLLE